MVAGILNVDKPLGWTSHDVVGLVRRLTGVRQVGHAGTLDPLATGVLLVGVGAATRLSDYLMGGRKCYAARVRLGVRTSTDDAEGSVVETLPTDGVTRARVIDALAPFRGAITQIPPAYAAIKKNGVPAYKLARRGEAPEMAARTVRIDALAMTGLRDDTLDLLVWCGPGTYIRALARDVGERLRCGAHLAALRRLSSGGFGVDTAVGVGEMRVLAAEGRLHERFWPLDTAVSTWPALVVVDDASAGIAHGMPVEGPAPALVGEMSADARLYGCAGDLLALARYDGARRVWQPRTVFAASSESAAGRGR